MHIYVGDLSLGYYSGGEWMRTQILSRSHTGIPGLPWSCTLHPSPIHLPAQAVTGRFPAVLRTDPTCTRLPPPQSLSFICENWPRWLWPDCRHSYLISMYMV